MKGRTRTAAQGGLLLALGLLLIRYPDGSLQAAREGVFLCLELLLPSLFPFFVLSSLLIATGLAETLSRPFTAVMRPLFGVDGPGAAVLGLGLIGGYPAGARAAAQLAEGGGCTKSEARRLALFCNNCGPAFFLGAAGAGIFGSREAGLLLLLANLAAALLLALCLRLLLGPAESREGNVTQAPPLPLAEAFPQSVREAFAATLNVCAYVILFSVLTALADCSGLLTLCTTLLSGLFPGENASALCRSLLVGLLEISTGTASLQGNAGAAGALPLAAFLLGFGGLSVHCQSLPFLQSTGVRLGAYLTAKLFQGLLAALLTGVLASLVPLSLPAMAGSWPQTGLVHQELLALWAAAGGYFFLVPSKRSGNGRRNPL